MKAANNGELNTMDRQLEAIQHAAAQIEANPSTPYTFEDLLATVVPNDIAVEAVS